MGGEREGAMQKLKIAHEAEIDLLQIDSHRWVSATNVPQKLLIDQLQVYLCITCTTCGYSRYVKSFCTSTRIAAKRLLPEAGHSSSHKSDT